MLVVLFCQWCRALLPHLEESAILEHFITVVSSYCPCLRGLRISLSHVILFWLLITCLSFWFISFFLLSLNWLLCVSMHSSRRRSRT
jgi:hypothetical protein